MGGSSSDHVVLISALSGWPLIKQGQWVDKDELGVSVAPSPARSSPGVCLTIKPIFVLTCQWPAPLHPVASKGMVNQAFHVPRHVGLFTALLTPLCLPEGSQLSGASRNSGCTPCCCVIPMPSFFKTSSYTVACWTTLQQTKLMSQIWAYSELTDLTLLLILRSLIQLLQGVETHLGQFLRKQG